MHKNLLFICRRSRIVVCLLQKYFLRIKRSIIGSVAEPHCRMPAAEINPDKIFFENRGCIFE